MRATCPAHLTLLDFLTVVLYGNVKAKLFPY